MASVANGLILFLVAFNGKDAPNDRACVPVHRRVSSGPRNAVVPRMWKDCF